MADHRQAPCPLIPGSVPLRGKAAAKAIVRADGSTTVGKWEWRTFTNQARTDGLELRHWQRQGTHLEEYMPSKFNKNAEIFKYTDDEYVRNLACSDWSKQDTDMLMKLVQRFELNFIVIADRWSGAPRKIEALKDRFYAVQRKMAEVKGLAQGGAEENPESVLLANPYSKEWEEARKAAMEKTFARSKAEDKTEREVLEAAAKIEEKQKRRKAEQRRKKSGEGGEDGEGGCAPGGIVLRSQIMCRSQDQVHASRWLESIDIKIALCAQQTQGPFQTLCADVVSLLDWQKKSTRKKKERDALLEKKNDISRPLKKRKTAPSQRLADVQGGGGGGGQAASHAQAQQAQNLGRMPQPVAQSQAAARAGGQPPPAASQQRRRH